MFGLLSTLVGTQLHFGGEDPARGRPWYHEKITWEAARDASWATGAGEPKPAEGEPAEFDFVESRPSQETAAAALAWHADYLDSYLYNPFWWAAGGVSRFKIAVLHHDELLKLHFDDLRSPQQVMLAWMRIEQGTIAALQWALTRPDVGDRIGLARNIVGASLHATQDFYSHSNWVDDKDRRGEIGDTDRRGKTWAEYGPSSLAPDDPRAQMHLYTGSYEGPEGGAFKSHGTFAFDCALLKRLPSTLMQALCGGRLSPISGTSLCERWRACQDAVPGRPDQVLDPAVPTDIIYLQAGIAVDSKWMAEVNVKNRDLPSGTEVTPHDVFTQAQELARRHSKQWLDTLTETMTARGLGEAWGEVMTVERTGDRHLPLPDDVAEFVGVYAHDLRQWEDPWRRAFTFLSAGNYPPRPDASEDTGWFLRIDLTTGGDPAHSDLLLAGTNSDIDLIVDGGGPGEICPLDHRPRRPEGDRPSDHVLEHYDFAAGARDSYVVGPFATVPTRLALRNAASPTAFDLLEAAFRDFADIVVSIKDALLKFVLEATQLNADKIGAEVRSWSWAELMGIQQGLEHAESVRIAGGKEGDYEIAFSFITRESAAGLDVTFQTRSLHCRRESTRDLFSLRDEPVVMMMLSNPGASAEPLVWSRGYTRINSGDTRPLDFSGTVTVPRYSGLVVGTQMVESDLEGIEGRRDILDTFRTGYEERTGFGRSAFLDTLAKLVAPDWLLGRVDVHAFRRLPEAELVTLVHDRPVGRWISAGTSLDIPVVTGLPSGPPAFGSQMRPGQVMYAGQALWSPNGRYALCYQTDGNLVLYGPAGALFHTETGGRAAGVVIMQQDGNLQIHAQGEPVRQINSETSEPGAWLVVQDDGNVVIYKPAGGHVWASQTGTPMITSVQNNQIRPGQGLYPGQSVWSNNGRYALWYQTDGNLVLAGPAGVVKAWDTTDMLPGVLIMQQDGHLVLHSPGGREVRVIGGTSDLPGAFFVLQDNAEAAIYTADSQTKTWTSGTGVPDGPVATSPYMRAGEILLPNHGRITSPEGAYALIYQPDGNLVLSGPNGYLWDTGTDHQPVGVAMMQDDGNLVITSYGGGYVTDTSTHGNPGSFAMVRDDGKFVIARPDGDVIFQEPH